MNQKEIKSLVARRSGLTNALHQLRTARVTLESCNRQLKRLNEQEKAARGDALRKIEHRKAKLSRRRDKTAATIERQEAFVKERAQSEIDENQRIINQIG
jgi:hypothetical protein